MDKLFVVDAAGYLYRSYHAIQGMTNGEGQSTNALFGFVRSVRKLIKDFDPKFLIAVFDGPDNTKARKEIYADYKANRAQMPGDLRYQIDWAQRFCTLAGIPYLCLPEVEADDTMGTIARWGPGHQFEVYLCTSDKDMAQLVNDDVKLLNTFKDNLVIDSSKVEEIYGVPPEQMVDWLAITGDASDNVPGMPGFGPKTATQLLQQFSTLENLLAHPDEVKGTKKQETLKEFAQQALMSRQLVTIHTDVSIPHRRDAYALQPPQVDDLKDFYRTMDFSSLQRELESAADQSQESKEETLYHLVNAQEELETLLQKLESEPRIVFDTETTSEHPMRAELVGVGLGCRAGEAWYVPLNGKIPREKALLLLKPFFENATLRFVAHNAKYDCHVLRNHGIRVACVGFDTMLASYLLNSHDRRHSLDHLALNVFNKVKTPIEALIGKGKNQITMDLVPIDKVSDYCCEDVDYTWRLMEVLEPQIKERHLEHLLYELELPLSRVLEDMERRGIGVSTRQLEELSTEFAEQSDRIAEEIYALSGERFNINSPKKLAEVLVSMGVKWPRGTKEGSTAADVLERLQEEVPVCAKVLEYRSLEKLKSTYCDTLPKEVLSQDHRIHCTFNQSVAATGRLSCQNPNLQNIPVRSPEGLRIREAFRPTKEGWVYLSADYSQIELRLLAHFSEDPHLVKAFLNQEDIHRSTASAIFQVPLEEVSKEQRHHAKAVNFGILYGQGANGLAYTLGIPYKAAKEFIQTYFQRFERVAAFIEECKAKAQQTKKAVTLTGRERLIPEIDSKNPVLRAAAERLAVNSPLQGTAADLIKYAMLCVDRELRKAALEAFMVLQIHDELIFETPKEEVQRLTPLVKGCMEGVWKLKVPLVVDVSIGKNWKEC